MENKLNFSECTLPLLEDRFGLRLVLELPALTAWLQRGASTRVRGTDQVLVRKGWDRGQCHAR